MDDINLQEVHDFLIAVARKAGGMIISAEPTVGEHGTKTNSADLVTETDKAVETMVSSELKARYPNFAFMGEETYQPGDTLTDAPTFIVDPIDGTANFVHGYSYVAISLGLTINRKPVVGVVLNPFTRQLYTGIAGQGAYVEEPGRAPRQLPLRTPEPFRDLSHCLLAVEWGSERTGNDWEVKAATFRTFCAGRELGGAMVHGLRTLGSSALNFCVVAAGTVDVYWEAGSWAWDVAAGWLILTEAGGRVVGAHPGDWNPQVDQRRYLAVRAGKGQEGIIEEVWRCVQGRVQVGYDAVT